MLLPSLACLSVDTPPWCVCVSFSQGLGIRRLGLLSNGCSSGGDVCGEGEENSVPTAVVDVSFVSLIVEKGRREDGDGVMREEEEEQTGVKNFKKFRKVHGVGEVGSCFNNFTLFLA